MLTEFPSARASYSGVFRELADTECRRASSTGRLGRREAGGEGEEEEDGCCVRGKICFVEAVTVEYGKNCA
jgi:hypothetical protein